MSEQALGVTVRDAELAGPQTPLRSAGLISIDTVCALLVAGITMLMFANVVFRYVLGQPLTWAEETVRYSFTWLAFMSAALAMKYHGHMAIEFGASLLPPALTNARRILVELLVAAFLAVFVYYSARMAGIAHGQTSSALRMPMSFVYAAAPVSSLLMLGYTTRNIVQALRRRSPS